MRPGVLRETSARFGACFIAALALGGCAITPRTDRDWDPYLAHTADVEVADGRFTVTPVNDWSYRQSGPTDMSFRDASFAIDEVRDVWFLLEPQPGSKIAAHTLLLFEFEGDRMLGVTIEARREVGEGYSAWRGLWNRYELSYVWASARDLVTRRAVMLGHDIYVYPLAISEEQKRGLLTNLLVRTEELETEPRWYNTITSNCTNELARAAGIEWDSAFILTGKSDEYLFRHGLIPGSSFEAAEEQADVTAFVRSLNEADPGAFDALFLNELRTRRDAAQSRDAEQP